MATIITRAGKASALTATEYDNALKRETTSVAGNHTVAAANNRSTIEYTGTGTHTITLPDCSSLVAAEDTGDFTVRIKNRSSNGSSVAIALTGANTIDGVASGITLYANDSVTLKAGTGDDWMILNSWSYRPIIQETAQAGDTETAILFTGIPAWVTQITVSLLNLSTSAIAPSVGNVVPKIRIGGSGGIESADYVGSVMTFISSGNAVDSLSTGFNIATSWSAAGVVTGTYVLSKITGNTWACNGGIGYSNTSALSTTRGYTTLDSALTQLNVTMNGTDKFDGNTYINISYC